MRPLHSESPTASGTCPVVHLAPPLLLGRALALGDWATECRCQREVVGAAFPRAAFSSLHVLSLCSSSAWAASWGVSVCAFHTTRPLQAGRGTHPEAARGEETCTSSTLPEKLALRQGKLRCGSRAHSGLREPRGRPCRSGKRRTAGATAGKDSCAAQSPAGRWD